MIQTQPTAVELVAPSATRPLLWLLIVLLGSIFFAAGHQWNVSLSETFSAAADEAGQTVAGGDTMRRVAFSTIALIGLCLLVCKAPTTRGLSRFSRSENGTVPFQKWQPWLGALVIAYLSWCLLSVIWAVHPSLTITRLAVLVFCSIGALGIARQLSAWEICLLAVAVTAAYIAVGVCTEVTLGAFWPFSTDYRFAGTLHPNAQGALCAVLCLGSFCLAIEQPRRRVWLVALFVAGLAMLFLTRSRTSFAALLAAMLALLALRGSWRTKAIIGIALPWVLCACVLVILLFSIPIGEKLTGAVLMGRQDEAFSLSGRMPLWAELMPYVRDNLMLGYGYDSFWTPKNVQDISSAFDWTIPDAHSAYLDMVLGVGLIGAALGLLVLAGGIRESAVRYKATGNVGYEFIFSLLVYGVLASLLESSFVLMTNFVSFVAACGLVHLAFYPEDTSTRFVGCVERTKTDLMRDIKPVRSTHPTERR